MPLYIVGKVLYNRKERRRERWRERERERETEKLMLADSGQTRVGVFLRWKDRFSTTIDDSTFE